MAISRDDYAVPPNSEVVYLQWSGSQTAEEGCFLLGGSAQRHLVYCCENRILTPCSLTWAITQPWEL